MIITIIAIITFLSTFVGGLLALKYINKISLIIALTAGIIVGLIVFDVIPEIFNLAIATKTNLYLPIVVIIASFFIFHFFENIFLIHRCEGKNYKNHQHTQVGVISGIMLIIHSFLDGLGVGTGLNVSTTFGILIAIAVIGPDFADGVNTVALLVSHKNTNKTAIYFLILDSLAPVFGILAAAIIKLPEVFILIYLSYFTGSLLYIAFSDIIPQAHASNGFKKTFILSLFGIIFMGVLSYFTKLLI